MAFERLKAAWAALTERRGLVGPTNPQDPAYWLVKLFGSEPAHAGVAVNEQSAVGWTALTSGVQLLAQSLASLPIDVLRRLEPRGRQPLPLHPAARVLRDPNPEMTGFEFRELLQSQILWWGNGYAQIVWDGRDNPVELWPLPPDRVTVERDGRGLVQYRVSVPQTPFAREIEQRILPADEVLHIRGWSRFGILGERMMQNYREAIGLGLVTELFGALFFGQGANASGFLEHPGNLSTDAQKRLIESKEKQMSGLPRAHRLAVLEEGMKFHQMTVDPEKAQFLGLRKFQVTEAARILRVPPHMIYDLERATFSNIEHSNIEFVTYTATPWAVRWEERLRHHLLGLKDRARVYFKFSLNGLLRGDTAARVNFYQSGIQNGWLSQNDVREYEDLNPIDGGDTYRAPVNLAPVDAPPPAPTPPPADPEEPDDDAEEVPDRQAA